MAGDDKNADEAAALELFLKIGLDETVAKNQAVNAKNRRTLVEIIKEANATDGAPKAKGNLLYYMAGKYPANALVHRPTLLAYVMNEGIKSNPQLDGAHEYLKKIGSEALDKAELEKSAGVGIVITPEQIKEAVTAVIKENEARLKEERYRLNINAFLGQITKALKWADGNAVRAELESQREALIGPKTEEDDKPVEKKKEKPPKPPKEPAPSNAAGAAAGNAAGGEAAPTPSEPAAPADPYAHLPKPEANNNVHTTVNFSDGRIMRIANTPEQLRKHLEVTKGKVMTRFPPEPNGYLHIGHAKAMFVDFGMAEHYDGHCYLRYDDTNPAAEKLEYIEHIEDIVSWMGWKPWKVTYSSDYFQELYDMAVWLIENGHAFVCHQTKDEIDKSRERREPSPWRDRPKEESLRWFEDMRRGLVDEGKATLRLKMDHKNENFNMFDLVAYRIKFMAHPHAGDKWCVYPSYDYTHCIVDSLENITHSLCTLEFESRRASYYWLLEVLGLYKPCVWEYSRLNVTNTLMSKRKLNRLVTGKYVKGWDDPRLLTLAGLRRRGVTPAAINSFCREIGITRNDNMIPMHKLEHHMRLDLDATSPRMLAVLRPLKVVITNLPETHYEEVEASVFPGRSKDTYKVPFTRIVYIEATDFKEQDETDYRGMAPGKSVMLRYAYMIKYKDHVKDAKGNVTELHVEVDTVTKPKGKKGQEIGVLNWVGQPKPGQEPEKFEARLYDYLFLREKPEESADWINDINPDSLKIEWAFGSPPLYKAQPGDRFQFERLGYFCVDPDSEPGHLVINRTVSLKDPYAKQREEEEKKQKAEEEKAKADAAKKAKEEEKKAKKAGAAAA